MLKVDGVMGKADSLMLGLNTIAGGNAGGELNLMVKSIRELADDFDKRSGALISDGRRTLGDISRAVNNFDRNPSRVIFGGSNNAAPAASRAATGRQPPTDRRGSRCAERTEAAVDGRRLTMLRRAALRCRINPLRSCRCQERVSIGITASRRHRPDRHIERVSDQSAARDLRSGLDSEAQQRILLRLPVDRRHRNCVARSRHSRSLLRFASAISGVIGTFGNAWRELRLKSSGDAVTTYHAARAAFSGSLSASTGDRREPQAARSRPQSSSHKRFQHEIDRSSIQRQTGLHGLASLTCRVR